MSPKKAKNTHLQSRVLEKKTVLNYFYLKLQKKQNRS